MTPTDKQLNEWGDRLFELKDEMELAGWLATPEAHQRDYVSLVHLAWKSVRQEARQRAEAPVLKPKETL